jgi:hypothetical protein
MELPWIDPDDRAFNCQLRPRQEPRDEITKLFVQFLDMIGEHSSPIMKDFKVRFIPLRCGREAWTRELGERTQVESVDHESKAVEQISASKDSWIQPNGHFSIYYLLKGLHLSPLQQIQHDSARCKSRPDGN